ncbi:FAD-dependent thymidylate synthase [Nakamurella lactea]|uniref:FAD-dependent thymidylate synthase n=1 Tax=Nakamurella lactea TaxID=459515 RepID=UPI0003FA30C5|nr:FAD-dependent thymidylate synthase [Nakamurella lactea]
MVPAQSGLIVQLIGRTEFTAPQDVPFETDAVGGQALAEFAGRSIYSSWERAVPATASNSGFLLHLLQVGHLSVLEHSSATFYLRGLSRSVTHEFLRHRHFSYSELSPRAEPQDVVEPAAIGADPVLHQRFQTAVAQARTAYEDLLDGLQQAGTSRPDGSLARKQARQAARAVLPLAQSTAIVVTGNYRAWRHFIGMRATEAADVELRMLAVALLAELQREAPHVFADFRISTLADGTSTAASPYVGDG